MSAKTSTRKAGGTALRFGLLLGLLAAVVLGTWTAVRYSVAARGEADGQTALIATVVLAVLTLTLAGMSARRVRDDLSDYRRAHEGATAAVGQVVRGSAITGMAVRGATRGAADLVDQLAAFLTGMLGLAAVGWAVETTLPGVVTWLGGAGLALLAGWTISARVAAWGGQRLRAPHLGLGVLAPGVVSGLLGGAGMWLAGSTLGRVEWPTVLSAAVMGASVGVLAVGGRAQRAADRRRDALRGQVAAILGVGDSQLAQDGDVRWGVSRDGRVTIQPGPAVVARAASDAGLEGRVTAILPTHTVDETTTSASQGVVLVPATPEVTEQRRLAAETEGLAVRVERIDDDPADLGGPTQRERWTLASTVSPAHAGRVETVARQRGLSLLRWLPLDREARLGVLSPEAADVRERIAAVLKCDPWDVAVRVVGSPERDVDTVTITRAPWPTGDARTKALREIVLRLPDGNPGWAVEDNVAAGRVTLAWRQRPELPATVALADLLPETVSPEAWARLPLGVAADGSVLGIDLGAGPHALVAGPTGAGKTVALLTLVTSALARGHRLVVIDPTKAGLDFASLRPWCTAWADDYATARAAIERVYAEVARRKAVLKEHEEVKWSDLSPAVRDAEQIAPLTVLIDEYGSLALDASVPKGLDKEDPLVISATELNAQKAVLKELVGRIAREARFVGIHLQIALQRPDVAVMGSGELRSNLTSAIQLAPPGRGVSLDALRMVFTADVVESAAEQIRVLDDGTSRGLAVVAAEGGTARGVRVGYSPMRAIPALLERIGVPRVDDPWDLGVAAVSVSAPVEGEVIEVMSTPEIDLGEFTFSLDDLAPEPTPEPEPEPEPARPAKRPSRQSDDGWGF